MNDLIGELLAKVLQRDLMKGEARSIAAGYWLTGRVISDDLIGFDAEVRKNALESEIAENTTAAKMLKATKKPRASRAGKRPSRRAARRTPKKATPKAKASGPKRRG